MSDSNNSPDLAGYGKTILTQENFDGPHACLQRAQSSGTTEGQSLGMLKQARLLTRQAPAGEKSDFFSILLVRSLLLRPLILRDRAC